MASTNTIGKIINLFVHTPGRSFALKPKVVSILAEDLKNVKLMTKADTFTKATENAVEALSSTVSKELSFGQRAMTDLDRMCIKSYAMLKRLDLNITAKELEKLFKFEGEKYHQEAFKFLCKKMRIPKKLRPKMKYEKLDADTFMAYSHDNILRVNSDYASQLDKVTFLAFLRHELQHWKQFMKMLATENLGENVIKFDAKIDKAFVDSVIRNTSPEELSQYCSKKFIPRIKKLQELLKSNKVYEYETGLDNVIKSIEKDNLQQYEKIRNTVLKEFGIIKDGTKEAKRAEKMFQELMPENFYTQNGITNYAQYCGNCGENEASIAQNALAYKIASMQGYKGCYIKDLKAQGKAIAETLVTKAEVEKIAGEVTHNLSIDDFIRYMYD